MNNTETRIVHYHYICKMNYYALQKRVSLNIDNLNYHINNT